MLPSIPIDDRHLHDLTILQDGSVRSINGLDRSVGAHGVLRDDARNFRSVPGDIVELLISVHGLTKNKRRQMGLSIAPQIEE